MGKGPKKKAENVQAESVQAVTTQSKPLQEGKVKEKDESKTSGMLLGKNSKNNLLKWVIAAAAFAAAAIVVATVVYVNSPNYKAYQALELGERYLEEMDYERAVVKFIEALELAPRDQEIAAAIYGHLNDLLILAQDYGESNDYGTEREIAALVLRFDSKNSQGDELLADSLSKDQNGRELFDRANALIRDADKRELIDQGNQAFENGDYEDAREKYEQAVEKGATEDEVSPELPLCRAYLDLLDLCGQGDWQGVADYIDSVKFDPIADYMDVANPQYASRYVNILITRKDDCYIVITEDWTADGTSGYGTAVISSANTYAIYEGEWKDSVPNGYGILRIWYKNQTMEDCIQYSGSFEDGLLNGEADLNVLVDGNAVNLDITVSSGSVQVFTTDEEGRVWLRDAVDDSTNTYIVIVDNAKENNGAIADYIAGVPGYGGSDDIISVYYLIFDTEPPVLKCSLKRNTWYNTSWEVQIPIGYGITASDNVDGDITDRITYTSTKEQTDWQKQYGYSYNDWEYRLTVVYSAKDTFGNVATLTVLYEFASYCEDLYKVVSVN